MSKHECEQENCEEYLGLLDSKVVQIPIGLFLKDLPNPQPALSLPIWDDLSFYILLWVIQG